MKIILGFLLTILMTLMIAMAKKSDHNFSSKVLLKTTQSWTGRNLPAYPKGQPEVTMLKITIPVGVKLPLHLHPMINAGILLKGELTVITENGYKRQLHANDSIVGVVNTWHFGKNTGTIPAEIIVFYAGIKGQPVTINK